MYKVKINGKNFEIPSELSEVTIKRFLDLRLIAPDDTMELVYWGIGQRINFEHKDNTVVEMGAALGLIDLIRSEIAAFVNNIENIVIPKSITIMGLEVKLIDGLLNELPYWPYVVAKKLLTDETKAVTPDHTKHIGRIVGHYLYSSITKEVYNEAKADRFADEMADEMPMVETIQLGNFFLLKHIDLLPSKKKNLFRKLKKNLEKQV